jgi:hypothetical protein
LSELKTTHAHVIALGNVVPIRKSGGCSAALQGKQKMKNEM